MIRGLWLNRNLGVKKGLAIQDEQVERLLWVMVRAFRV